MAPERRANLRRKIEEAYAQGSRPNLHATFMPITMGELMELLETADRLENLTNTTLRKPI